MASFESILKSEDFMGAYSKFSNASTIGLLYVENPADRIFWELVISKACPNKYKVMPYSHELAPGKRRLEKEYDKLHSKYIVGVDGDFDYLCPFRHDNSNKLNTNPYVLHTFGYSRESITCSQSSISKIIEKIYYHNESPHQITKAIQSYSAEVYMAVCIFSYLHNKSWQAYAENEFKLAVSVRPNSCLLTNELNVDNEVLNELRSSILSYLSKMQVYVTDDDSYVLFKDELAQRGITPETAYMFIDGHYLKDKIVKPMLNAILKKNRNNDISGIRAKRPTQEWASSINEIKNYYESYCNPESLIHYCEGFVHEDFWGKIVSKLASINA